MAGKISMAARREVGSAGIDRSQLAARAGKGRIPDALCATTGWHRKHGVRARRRRATVGPGEVEAPQERKRRYGATVKDAMTALWEASDRVCGKRLKVMVPTLLPALEQHGRLQLGQADRDRVLAISAATIDRLLVDVNIAASGGRRRRAGFYSAIRREVPIRTFNDWNSPVPGFCEVDMVAHGGTSVAGSFKRQASRIAPMRRTMASSLGKIPTTSVRRLISPLRRSIGVVTGMRFLGANVPLRCSGSWRMVRPSGQRHREHDVRTGRCIR